MAFPFSILTLLIIISTISIAFASPSKCTTQKTLIAKQCITTHFPAFCCEAISQFATTDEKTPRELCKAGILASLDLTERVVNLLKDVTPADGVAIGGCKSDFGRSMGEIKHALDNYNSNVNESDIGIFKDAVVTYVLGALSDEEFCLENLSQSSVEADQKQVYAAIVRAVKIKKITATLINRL